MSLLLSIWNLKFYMFSFFDCFFYFFSFSLLDLLYIETQVILIEKENIRLNVLKTDKNKEMTEQKRNKNNEHENINVVMNKYYFFE